MSKSNFLVKKVIKATFNHPDKVRKIKSIAFETSLQSTVEEFMSINYPKKEYYLDYSYLIDDKENPNEV